MQEKHRVHPLAQTRIDSIEWTWKHYNMHSIDCVVYHNKDWSLKRRQIWDTFFLFVHKGCLHVQLDDAEFQVPAGHMLMLPPGMYHQLTSRTSDLHQIALHAHINNIWGESLLEKISTRVVKVPHYRYWRDAFHHSSNLMYHQQSIGTEILNSQLQTLMNELMMDGLDIDSSHHSNDPRIEHALQLINTRIEHDWTVEELAQISQLGVVQFRKLFKQQLHTTPKKYIHHKRIQESCHLLQYSQLKIKDIASSVGFQSDYYYQRSFKQAMNCTPSAYREQARI